MLQHILNLFSPSQSGPSKHGLHEMHIAAGALLIEAARLDGNFDLRERAAIERVLAACRAHGRHFGCGGQRDPKAQAAMIRRGARFLTTQTDIGLLSAGAGAWTRGIAAALDAG